MLLRLVHGTAFVLLWALPADAEGLSITPDLTDLTVSINGQTLAISRTGDDPAIQCPPNCVQPMQAVPGGQTLGALEVIGFLRAKVATESGRVLDVRLPADFASGHLPGAINVPLATLAADNPYRDDILQALGASKTAADWISQPPLCWWSMQMDRATIWRQTGCAPLWMQAIRLIKYYIFVVGCKNGSSLG